MQNNDNISVNTMVLHDIVMLSVVVCFVLAYTGYSDYKYAQKKDMVTGVRWNSTEIEYRKNDQWIQADQVRETRYTAIGEEVEYPE